MSWYLANEDRILGQFASACGIMDLRKAADDHHALLSFLDEGMTSDVAGCESDLKEIAKEGGDAGSTAEGLLALMKGQNHVSITDGTERSDGIVGLKEGWVTINGSHVLIGDDGKALEGGKWLEKAESDHRGTVNVDPSKITGINKTDPSKVKEIRQSMAKSGWQGRPLVVMPKDKEGFHAALTGSHRREAARDAYLEHVPAVVLTKKEAAVARKSAGWDSRSNLPRDPEGIADDLKAAGFTHAARLIHEN